MFKLIRNAYASGKNLLNMKNPLTQTRFKPIRHTQSAKNQNKSPLPKYILALALAGGLGYVLTRDNKKPQQKIEPNKSSTKDLADSKTKNVQEKVNQTGEKVVEKAGQIKDKASETARDVKDKVSEKAQDMKENIKETADNVRQKASDKAQDVKETAQNVKEGTKKAVLGTVGNANDQDSVYQDADIIAREMAGHDLGAGRSILEDQKEKNPEAYQALLDRIAELEKKIQDSKLPREEKTEDLSQLDSIKAQVTDKGKEYLDLAREKLGEIEGSVMEGSRNLGRMVADKASEKASDLKEAVKDKAGQAAVKAKDLAQQATSKVAESVQQTAAGASQRVSDAVKSTAKDASQRVTDAVKSTASALLPSSHEDKSRNPTAIDNDEIPGEKTSLKNKLLEKSADILQSFQPLKGIHQHLCGFHFYSGRMNEQVEAHHYCTHLNNDVMQCIIYDSDSSDARLIGIEYVITERIFRLLPEEEQLLWHSHLYEVKSGQLIAPGIPAPAEDVVMNELVRTYGKTFHTWQVDKHELLPLGIPQLMMAFTKDGQLDEAKLNARNKQLGIDMEERRKRRQDLDSPNPSDHGLADHWEVTSPRQLTLCKTE